MILLTPVIGMTAHPIRTATKNFPTYPSHILPAFMSAHSLGFHPRSVRNDHPQISVPPMYVERMGYTHAGTPFVSPPVKMVTSPSTNPATAPMIVPINSTLLISKSC